MGKFGDACILLTTQEGTLRFYACNVLGHSLYTVYTRSSRHSCTHHSGGAATHSNSLTRLTPRRTCRRSRAQAARQQPRPVVDLRRPVVDLRRPVHAPPVFIGMNMGANSWSMNASVCVTTSTPPFLRTRTRVAASRRGSRASRPQRRRTHLRGHTRVCIRSAQLQQLTTQGNYDADIIIRASSRDDIWHMNTCLLYTSPSPRD